MGRRARLDRQRLNSSISDSSLSPGRAGLEAAFPEPLQENATSPPEVTAGQHERVESQDRKIAGHHLSNIHILPPDAPDPSPIQRHTTPNISRSGQEVALPLQRPGDLGEQIRWRLGKGTPLPPQVQRALETGLGASLSNVGIHTDLHADSLARSVQAVAFTTGSDIFFRHGAYHPDTEEGMRLLAHEAVHTIQQSRGPVDGTSHREGVSISDPSDRFEQAADTAASAFVQGISAQRSLNGAPGASPGRGSGKVPIQRMPTSGDVIAQVGAPKANRKKFVVFGETKEMSSHYKDVLAALDNFHHFAGQAIAQTDQALQSQVTDLTNALDLVISFCNAYLTTGRDNPIAKRCEGLKSEAQLEKVAVRARLQYFRNNPAARQGTWEDALPKEMGTRIVDIEAEGGQFGAKASGNLNEVTKVTLESGYTGYFKSDKPWTGYVADKGQKTRDEWGTKIGKYTSKLAPLQNQMKDLQAQLLRTTDAKELRRLAREIDVVDEEIRRLKGKAKAAEGADTELMHAGSIGIDPNDPHFAKRNVAAYRVDQLFGAGVIPKTEFAIANGKMGTLMEEALGPSSGALQKSGRLFYSANQKRSAQTAPGADPNISRTHADDAGMQRFLSKLSLIDAIIGQIDRHHGNVHMQLNNLGHVTGVTGIDNDLTFPTKNFNADQSLNEFRGLPPYADKELAERILATTDDDLRAVVQDLLTPPEINAMIQRFHTVKAHLQTLQTNGALLDPNQWTALTATAQESTSKWSPKGYLGALKGALKPQGT